jgi:hypothetical protein
MLDGQPGSTPSTPTKRKASRDDDDDIKIKTPSKRAKKSVKRENLDGEPFSDASSPAAPVSNDLKTEEESKAELATYCTTAQPYYVSQNYYQNGYGQMSEVGSSASSSYVGGNSFASGSGYTN